MKYGTLYSYWSKNGEWGGDYCALCRKAKAAGMDVLEIGAGDLVGMSDTELSKLRDTAKELGLEISANLGPPRDKDVSSADPEIRKAGIKFLCDIMHQMKKIDCKILIGALYNCWPYDFVDLDKEALWARAVEGMKAVGDEADRLGITIALEVLNRFEGYLLNTAAEGAAFVREVDVPAVRLMLDTFHMNIEEDDLAAAIRAAGPRIAHVHVDDTNRLQPGTGHMDFAGVFAALGEVGYDGWLTFECRLRGRPEEALPASTRFLRGFLDG